MFAVDSANATPIDYNDHKCGIVGDTDHECGTMFVPYGKVSYVALLKL